MATIDQKRVIIAENLTQELPRRLNSKLGKIQLDVDSKEKNDMNNVFGKISEEMYDVIGNCLRCDRRTSENILSRILDENKDNVNRVIQGSRENLNGCILYNLKQVIMKENFSIQENVDEIGVEEAFTKTGQKIEGSFDYDVKNSEDKKDITRKTMNKTEDILRTEMKAQIKRALYQYGRQGDEAQYEISRIIDNKLIPQVQEKYSDNTNEIYNKLKSELVSEFEEVKTKCVREYNAELENEGKDKDKKALDFSDLIYNPGEEPDRGTKSENQTEKVRLEDLFK